MRMCFLALVTASLLQKESSTLHHEEALTQAANKWEESQGLHIFRKDTLCVNYNSAEQQLRLLFGKLNQTVGHETNEFFFIFFLTGCFCSVGNIQRDDNKSWLSAEGELPQQLSGKAQLPCYRPRRQVCSSHESSFDPECLSVFFLLHSDLTCQDSTVLV